MTVKTEDLPLEAIAKFCRHREIAELYQVPTEVKPWTGPFEDTEVFFLMKFRECTPPQGVHFLMGRYLSKLTGRKVVCGWMSAMMENWENDYIRDEVMATMEPVYVEPTTTAAYD